MTTADTMLRSRIDPEYCDTDYMLDEQRCLEFLQIALEADILAVDTETTGGDIRTGEGYCMGVSITYGFKNSSVARSNYFPFRHDSSNLSPSLIPQLKETIECHPNVVFHNAKFDLESLATLGIYPNNWWDTMLMAHMVNENLPSKGLDYIAQNVLSIPGKAYSDTFVYFRDKKGWAKIPPELMYDYACQDSYLTLKLFQHYGPLFKAQGFMPLWPYEQKFVNVIRTMERRGILIDRDLCEEEAEKGTWRMKEILEELGYEKLGPKALEDLLIGKLDLPVVKRTDGGKVSFNKEAMEEYDAMLQQVDDPTAQLILEYRGWQKAVSSNYLSYLKLVSWDDRLHPNYKIHGTVTGRMSCEEPNLQQIPRSSDKEWNGKLKAAFIPEDGYTLWEADYSQLELRLAAAVAKEHTLIAIFSDPDRDVFSEMAEQLNMPRYQAKTLTYTIQYGGGVKRISHIFGVSMNRARSIRENFYDTYEGFREVVAKATKSATKNKYVTYWTGRRRHFQYGSEEAHKAFNAWNQGGAAEIVKRAMIRLYKEVDSEQECRMLLQVHDSVVFEIKNGLEDKYLPKIKEIMEDVQPDFGVVFRVDIHKWGES